MAVQQKNKPLVPEALDMLFNRRLRNGGTLMVASLHSAHRPEGNRKRAFNS